MEYGAFAFPDTGGTKLLVTAELTQPESLEQPRGKQEKSR
jgi:hypothetical protein